MEVDVSERGNGVRFTVRVTPRASRNEIAGSQEGVLRVRLCAPPVEGAANKALVSLLAGALRVPRRDVEVVAGHTGRQKVVHVEGISPQEASARLAGKTPPR
jgi:uncharacterized protein (TIGR00251 family)